MRAAVLAQVLGVEAQRAITQMRRRVEEHILRLPVRYFDTTQTGQLISRIMNDAEGIRNLVGTGLVGGLTRLVLVLLLDDVDAHRRGIEQHIHQVVVEQVDLVDIKDVAVCFGEHPGLEAALTALDGGLDIDRADDAVLRCGSTARAVTPAGASTTSVNSVAVNWLP